MTLRRKSERLTVPTGVGKLSSIRDQSLPFKSIESALRTGSQYEIRVSLDDESSIHRASGLAEKMEYCELANAKSFTVIRLRLKFEACFGSGGSF